MNNGELKRVQRPKSTIATACIVGKYKITMLSIGDTKVCSRSGRGNRDEK